MPAHLESNKGPVLPHPCGLVGDAADLDDGVDGHVEENESHEVHPDGKLRLAILEDGPGERVLPSVALAANEALHPVVFVTVPPRHRAA